MAHNYDKIKHLVYFLLELINTLKHFISIHIPFLIPFQKPLMFFLFYSN